MNATTEGYGYFFATQYLGCYPSKYRILNDADGFLHSRVNVSNIGKLAYGHILCGG